MNQLQQFILRGNRQSQSAMQELFEINGSQIYLTIGQVTPNVDMLRHGYNEWATAQLSGRAELFASKPQLRQEIKRMQTGKVFLIQKADCDDPVIWELFLVDREPNTST